jgi:hypothetical protein
MYIKWKMSIIMYSYTLYNMCTYIVTYVGVDIKKHIYTYQGLKLCVVCYYEVYIRVRLKNV